MSQCLRVQRVGLQRPSLQRIVTPNSTDEVLKHTVSYTQRYKYSRETEDVSIHFSILALQIRLFKFVASGLFSDLSVNTE